MNGNHQPQPDGSARDQWTIRTDAGARKVVERLDALTAEVKQFNARVKKRPTKAQMAMAVLTAITAASATVWGFVEKGKGEALAAIAEQKKETGAQVMQLRTENQSTANRIEARLDKSDERLDRWMRALTRGRRSADAEPASVER